MQQDNERVYFMDTMRAVLMMLGVVLHSSQVFSAEHTWVIYSDNAIRFADWLVSLVHAFRMPAFFAVAGFFCALTWRKYGRQRFLQMRMVRLGVPMVVTAATLNSLQALLLVKYGWANYGISQYLKAGAWVSHLWFMINLLIYHIVAYVSIVWFAKGTQVARRAAVRLMSSLPSWTWLVLLPLLNVLAVMIAHFLPGPGVWSMGALDSRSLLYYFPFFAIGALLHERRALLLRFCAMRSFRIAIWFVISWPLASASQDWLDGMLLGVTTVYLEALTAWAGVALCFNVFSLAARAPTPLTRTLSDASYTVYLFHHLLVIIFGMMMINLRIGGVLGLLALVTVVVTTALMIHRYIISPYRVMRFLFNGK